MKSINCLLYQLSAKQIAFFELTMSFRISNLNRHMYQRRLISRLYCARCVQTQHYRQNRSLYIITISKLLKKLRLQNLEQKSIKG